MSVRLAVVRQDQRAEDSASVEHRSQLPEIFFRKTFGAMALPALLPFVRRAAERQIQRMECDERIC